MFVRICLVVLLAVAMATGCAPAGDVTNDLQAELAEIEIGDAVLARTIELPAPLASPAPPLVRGTEVEHASPPPGRVFRPPRAALG